MLHLIRMTTSVSLIVLLTLTLSGCAGTAINPPELSKQQVTEDTASKEKTLMEKFNAIQEKKDVSLPEIITFIDGHISTVSKPNATAMVLALEKHQKEKLPALQDKFGDNQSVQNILASIYKKGLSGQSIANMKDSDEKSLLAETLASAFKVETAEGMYFPVIDYSKYKKYRAAVTQDMMAYIDIMAVESDKSPMKDAALTISWSEIIKRALAQEQFIKEYVHSAKAENMEQLLKRYTSFALYGGNNTPLFNYDTRHIMPEAKQAYTEQPFDVNKGVFSKAMAGYLDVLKRSDYTLTQEVENYRKTVSDL